MKLNYLYILGIVLIAFGCKRPTDPLGNDLKVASDAFSISAIGTNEANPNFVGYYQNSVAFPAPFFTSTFNEEVSWTLTIRGKITGATKTFKGTGNELTAGNSTWTGDASSIEFFADNDTCTVELTVTGSDSVFMGPQIVVASTKPYHNQTYNGVRSLVVDDFDGGEMLWEFGTPALDGADGGTPLFQTSSAVKVQGQNSFYMYGIDLNNNSWSGSMNQNSLLELVDTSAAMIFIDSLVKPEDFYINVYVYGTGKANSGVQLKTYEIDSADTRDFMISRISSGTYVYDQSINDGWIFDLLVDWEGWRLVSIPYTKFRAGNELGSGGNGNRVKEPWKISAMAISLISLPAYGQEVDAFVDYVIFTEGGVFKP